MYLITLGGEHCIEIWVSDSSIKGGGCPNLDILSSVPDSDVSFDSPKGWTIEAPRKGTIYVDLLVVHSPCTIMPFII